MIPLVNIKEIPSLNTDFKIKSNFDLEIDMILQESLRTVKDENLLGLIFSLIDFTSLSGSDTDAKIEEMCHHVLALEKFTNFPNVAAICVYPVFANLVRDKLKNTKIHTACVAGAFPSGQSSMAIKLDEVKWAINEGASEIDMVISRGKLIEGNYQAVFDEIVAVKKCCREVHLKVIIECGELGNNKNIRIASDLAMYAGADFIKTSTGKISDGASYNSVYIMLNAIADFYEDTGIRIGIKPSGGIRDVSTAKNYLKFAEQILGQDWLNSVLFRFGASSLANNVLNEIARLSGQPELNNHFV